MHALEEWRAVLSLFQSRLGCASMVWREADDLLSDVFQLSHGRTKFLPPLLKRVSFI